MNCTAQLIYKYNVTPEVEAEKGKVQWNDFYELVVGSAAGTQAKGAHERSYLEKK